MVKKVLFLFASWLMLVSWAEAHTAKKGNLRTYLNEELADLRAAGAENKIILLIIRETLVKEAIELKKIETLLKDLQNLEENLFRVVLGIGGLLVLGFGSQIVLQIYDIHQNSPRI